LENVHGLRVFLAVADSLSFTRAAETLFLTQSAVSHQIGNLEKELAVELFERSGRRVSLTPAGRALVTQARRVFATIDSAVDAVQQAGQGGQGRIRVGASATACQYIIPEALREFRECFPKYSLSIIPGDSPVSQEHLLAGTIDLAIMLRTERNRRLQFHPLFEDELQLIVSPLHPWAKAGHVDRRQIGSQSMILYGRNSATFRLVEQYFAKMRIPLRDWIELGDLSAIKELVKLGLGVSVMARWVMLQDIRQGSLVSLPLGGAKLKRHWCISTVNGRKLSLPEQTFINLCQAAAAKIAKLT